MQKINYKIFQHREIIIFDSKTHKPCYTNWELKAALIPIAGKIHVCIAYKTYAVKN